MRTRVFVLSSLIATAGIAMGLAGPPLLVPADGSPTSVGREPVNLAIGDVNKDGRPDLVVASGQGLRVTILLGQGDGRFAQMPAEAFAVPERSSEMALGDVNGDGNLDLALASHDSYRIVLLSGDGRGSFRLAPSSPIVMKDGRQPTRTALASPTSMRTARPTSSP